MTNNELAQAVRNVCEVYLRLSIEQRIMFGLSQHPKRRVIMTLLTDRVTVEPLTVFEESADAMREAMKALDAVMRLRKARDGDIQ